MKRICLLSLLLLFAIGYSQAQDSLKVQPYPVSEDEHLRQIDIRELPEVVTDQIASQDYSSWILQAAWRVASGTGESILPSDDYVVELRRHDDEIIRIRFDYQGNRISDPLPEE